MTYLNIDELNKLRFCVMNSPVDCKNIQTLDELNNLIGKIETMIKVYCNHVPDGRHIELQAEYKCKNCGEYYID